jgi:hypothetical protein
VGREGDGVTFHNEAVALLDLLESDFGQSGRDVRIEAIRCELQGAAAVNRVVVGALRDLLQCCEKHPAFSNQENRITLGRVERARIALAMVEPACEDCGMHDGKHRLQCPAKARSHIAMKHRIRATFNPPAVYLHNGAMPEQVERMCDGPAELSEQLRELIYAGKNLLDLKARLVIEITPVTLERPLVKP